MKPQIRLYHPEDAPTLTAIFYAAVHDNPAYTEVQRAAWAPKSVLETEGWRKKWEKQLPFVAVWKEKPVGFAEFESQNLRGFIDCFYVHPSAQRKGVGSALMDFLFDEVLRKAITSISAEVSVNARPFFEAKGFRVVAEQSILRHGVALKNFVMEKHRGSDKNKGEYSR